MSDHLPLLTDLEYNLLVDQLGVSTHDTIQFIDIETTNTTFNDNLNLPSTNLRYW